MFSRTDRRGTALALMIAVVVIATAVPVFQMVGCNMSTCDGMMAIPAHLGLSIDNACGGSWVLTSGGQPGVPPTEPIALLLVLLAAIAAAAALFSPRAAVKRVRIMDAESPPPPLEPRGERFTI